MEIVIAMLVFSVGVLAIAAMQTSAIQGNAFANHMSEGTISMQDKMEELMTLNYGDGQWTDIDADSAAGLDDVGAQADWWDNESSPSTCYNVAVNGNTKIVRVIYTWDEGCVTKNIHFDSVRASAID